MARTTNQWALVLDQADADTRALILKMQLQDLAIAETDVGSQTTKALGDGMTMMSKFARVIRHAEIQG